MDFWGHGTVSICKALGEDVVESSAKRTHFADYVISRIMQGTIARLTDKGFGFITQQGGGKDVFFHSSVLVGATFNDLKVGDTVTFEVEESEKGPRAVNVQKA